MGACQKHELKVSSHGILLHDEVVGKKIEGDVGCSTRRDAKVVRHASSRGHIGRTIVEICKYISSDLVALTPM